MGDIGPDRARYDVLPVPEIGLDDADDWTVAPREAAAGQHQTEARSAPDPGE